ncbi:Na+/H+ antiporter subunit E [Pseudogemmobacter sonorensis]|uniref:Na+/H+ antiporter subunit E n=1 Tax=Pseudogemmobacter sonorensis TaxID=2989681 RepID=UPI003695DD17
MMRRLVPHPLLTVGLVGMWLLLNGFSLGHAVLGTAIALVAGWALGALEPDRLRLRAPMAMFHLMRIVSYDIIRSNIAVAWLIATRGRRGTRKSAFVQIPLRIQDPVPLAVLAMIVTATPGSAWLEHDTDDNILLLHVFDLVDEAHWRNLIRDRYESLLLEIFE